MTPPDTGYRPVDIAEYNPSDLANLVRYVVEELLKRGPYRLPLPHPFIGAGIYALFYRGDFDAYQHPAICSENATRPIYVGRARFTKSSGPRPLYNRLHEHERSIVEANNLQIEDFQCRFLVLHPLWVSTVEDILIEYFDTLWNGPVQGFGVHDPGGHRHKGAIPIWDVLHPGRKHYWKMIEQGAPSLSFAEAIELVHEYQAQKNHEDRFVRISKEDIDRLIITDTNDG